MSDTAESALGPAPAPIGQSVVRRDAWAKVSGSACFTIDLHVPGMTHAKILRSLHPHARIRAIDTSAARSRPGVVAVVSATDLGDVDLFYGHAVRDHPLIAVEKVRYAGEPVAAVVAEDPLAAEEALAHIEVDYEPLPHVTDVLAALEPGAPVIHADLAERGEHAGFVETMADRAPNLCSRVEHAWGDIEAAFGAAHLVVDEVYEYPMAYAYAMEPYNAIAAFEDGQLTVWSSAQHPFMVRADLARCFRLPLNAVRVVVPYVGGGYGSKSYTKIEPLVAALALRARRPVRLALSVEESILTTRSVSTRIRLQTAFDADGTIRGRRGTIWANAGAYAENAPRVANKAAVRVLGPYRIPAAAIEALTVYTNTAPGSSYRGLGAPQAVFAGESQIDEAAERLGLDPLELRARNVLRRGERMWPGARGMDADIDADLRLAAGLIGLDAPTAPGEGRGIAVAASDAGAEPLSTAIVRVLADGSVIIMCGSVEMGQGSSTVLPQIAAAELGIDLDRVRLVNSDTALVSYDRSTGASRTTTVMGLAIQRAAADVRRQLLDWATALYGAEGPVEAETAGVRVGDHRMDWGRVVQDWFSAGAGEVIGRGYVRREGETLDLPLFWEVAALGLDVAVDDETGELDVRRLATVGDVGRAINPQLAEGQDQGAAMMGLGVALREELRYEDGALVNGNLYDYRYPRTTDMPEIRSTLAERADGIGPYGAKGGGEGSVNPVAPALANAVARAVGIRIRSAPLSPERVWRALEAQRAAASALEPDPKP